MTGRGELSAVDAALAHVRATVAAAPTLGRMAFIRVNAARIRPGKVGPADPLHTAIVGVVDALMPATAVDDALQQLLATVRGMPSNARRAWLRMVFDARMPYAPTASEVYEAVARLVSAVEHEARP